MKTDDSIIYLKFANALLLLEKQSKLNSRFCEQIQSTNEEFSLRHEFCTEYIIKSVRLNILNQKAYPFDYLQARYSLPLTKNSFSKEKIIYSKMLMENCDICK